MASAGKSTNAGIFLESLLSDDSVCEHDAVVLVDQMGVRAVVVLHRPGAKAYVQLHASDLRSLPSSSKIVQTINSAHSSVEIPYMRHSTENPFSDIADAIAQRCGSRVLSVSAGEVGPHLEDASNKKHVVCMGMPRLDGTAESRKGLMAEHGA